MKKISGLSLLLIATLLVHNTSATPVRLPTSSFYHGSTRYTYDDGNDILSGLIEFAVYDNPAEYEQAFDAPGDGQYLYAYQIFNGEESDAVAYFALLLNSPNADGIGSAQGDVNAIVPEPYPDGILEPDPPKAVWEFDNGLEGTLIVGAHSYYLLLTSDYGPVAGDYEIKPKSYVDYVYLPDVIPEPATIAMLGAGVAFVFARRRTNRFYRRR